MRAFLPPALPLSTLCLLAATAHAQTTFSLGPTVGYNLATAAYQESRYAAGATTASRSGLEAGLRALFSRGHVSVQPALLYSQKGFTLNRTVSSFLGGNSSYTNETHARLSYLTLPVSVAYTQRATGRGAQVFAGPYVGALLGGTYDYSTVRMANGTALREQGQGKVEVSDRYATTDPTDTRVYSQRLDAGLQVGAGYRLGSTLLQLSYSVGLRNLNATYAPNQGSTPAPTYQNRAFQVALTYIVGGSR